MVFFLTPIWHWYGTCLLNLEVAVGSTIKIFIFSSPPFIRDILHTWPLDVRKFDLVFVVVMVDSPKTMTKRISQHIWKALCQWDIVYNRLRPERSVFDEDIFQNNDSLGYFYYQNQTNS